MPEATLPNGIKISGTVEEIAALLAASQGSNSSASTDPDDEYEGRGIRARGRHVEAHSAALAQEFREIRARHTNKEISDLVKVTDNRDRA